MGLINFTTRVVRSYLVGKDQDFSFKATRDIDFVSINKTGLYLHIPFCKNICPYCPYNKIKYDKKWVGPYVSSLLSEIEQYYNRFGRLEITSIYVGGGTPTTLVNELGTVLDKIRERFNVTGDICVETNPGDLNQNVINSLTDYGVDMVSLGVQSFNDRYLKLLGRSYHSDILDYTIEMLLSSDFKSVNLDLMFALPGQTLPQLERDLERAVASGVNQVTAYPLFSFPYSTIGQYQKLKKVKMPNFAVRKKMYRTLHSFFLNQGFRRVSVWGFMRGEAPRYSSVTRDHYIGLGAGAGSHIPGCFYLNTFSIQEYINRCTAGHLPAVLRLDFTELMTIYYWLYWRLYDTNIPKIQLYELFGEDNAKLKLLLGLISFLKLADEDENQITLNERGAFWLHLMQNYFSLNYIDKVWTAAREEPNPKKISI